MNSAAQPKTVYVNDQPVGEASSWSEANALLVAKRILFIARPGKSEGPRGFYLDGSTLAEESKEKPASRLDTSEIRRLVSADHDASISEIAEMLIAQFGERAASHAFLEAIKARSRGAARHMEAWEQIANAVVRAMREEEELIERTTFVHRL